MEANNADNAPTAMRLGKPLPSLFIRTDATRARENEPIMAAVAEATTGA